MDRFLFEHELKKISVEGGGAIQLCDVGVGPRGGFWGTDGNIFFAGQRTPLMRVSQFGGTAVPVTELDKQKPEVTIASHRYFQAAKQSSLLPVLTTRMLKYRCDYADIGQEPYEKQFKERALRSLARRAKDLRLQLVSEPTPETVP